VLLRKKFAAAGRSGKKWAGDGVRHSATKPCVAFTRFWQHAEALLGAYKLAINGRWVGIGVDSIDVGAPVRTGSNTAIIGGYHASKNNTGRYTWAAGASVPRIALGLFVRFQTGLGMNVATDESWASYNAQLAMNPTGNSL
jgi:hypothetical protein